MSDRIDVANSQYHERADAARDFTPDELLKARYLLRRLRFLETQIARVGGLREGVSNGGAVHAELELSGLAWILGTEGINFLGRKR